MEPNHYINKRCLWNGKYCTHQPRGIELSFIKQKMFMEWLPGTHQPRGIIIIYQYLPKPQWIASNLSLEKWPDIAAA